MVGAHISITSEIGTLEKVIIHSPGFEVEEMTPKSAEQVLYNDIIPLPVMAEDHKQLKEVLKKVSQVYEIEDLLTDVLKNSAVKQEFLDCIQYFLPLMSNIRHELEAEDAGTLAHNVIIGVKEKKDSLTKFLSPNIFALPPLPNLYFMRDSSMVMNSQVITGSMANRVRSVEAIISKFVYKYHPHFMSDGFIFDGTREGVDGKVTIEGGDFLVLSKNILALGISARTTAESIDMITDKIPMNSDDPFYIFAVTLPKERATIHLDMIFTMVDVDHCVIHEPYVLGDAALPVVKITILPDGSKRYQYEQNLLQGLQKVGLSLKPIICGGKERLYQEREQWLSGTNFFAVAPGKILGYDCNVRTLEELSQAGFEVIYANQVLNGSKDLNSMGRCVVGISGTELARGGGGVRCMTMPVKRKPLV